MAIEPLTGTESESGSAPLLSICVPTYNRSSWLAAVLANIVPQAAAFSGLVEVVVSDNASADDTAEVVNRAVSSFGPIRYSRNETNIGAEPNYHKALSEVARGKYGWLLGDDDFLAAGAVAKVIDVLQKNPTLQYLYVNYIVWECSTPPIPGAPLPHLDPDRERHAGRADGPVSSVSEIVGGDHHCFTPMSCSIMPREKLAQAVYRDPTLVPFASARSVSPISVYIAGNLLASPAHCFAEPLTILGTASSWNKYLPAFNLVCIPELYDIYEENGVSRQIMNRLRRKLFRNCTEEYRRMVTDPNTPNRNLFSPAKFLRKHWRIPEALSLPYRTFVGAPISRLLWSFPPSRAVLHRVWRLQNRGSASSSQAMS